MLILFINYIFPPPLFVCACMNGILHDCIAYHHLYQAAALSTKRRPSQTASHPAADAEEIGRRRTFILAPSFHVPDKRKQMYLNLYANRIIWRNKWRTCEEEEELLCFCTHTTRRRRRLWLCTSIRNDDDGGGGPLLQYLPSSVVLLGWTDRYLCRTYLLSVGFCTIWISCTAASYYNALTSTRRVHVCSE